MKKGKVFAVAGVTLLAAGLLAACSGSNTSKTSSGEDKNYGYVYTDDPETLDYLYLLKLLHMISLQT